MIAKEDSKLRRPIREKGNLLEVNWTSDSPTAGWNLKEKWSGTNKRELDNPWKGKKCTRRLKRANSATIKYRKSKPIPKRNSSRGKYLPNSEVLHWRANSCNEKTRWVFWKVANHSGKRCLNGCYIPSWTYSKLKIQAAEACDDDANNTQKLSTAKNSTWNHTIKSQMCFSSRTTNRGAELIERQLYSWVNVTEEGPSNRTISLHGTWYSSSEMQS